MSRKTVAGIFLYGNHVSPLRWGSYHRAYGLKGARFASFQAVGFCYSPMRCSAQHAEKDRLHANLLNLERHMYVPRRQRMLDQYLQEIGQISLVTPNEEAELARRIKQGDEEALLQLTQANLRFVVSVAKKYQGQGLHLTDLINEGNYGLIKAAKRFDETRGFKFISYAVWWIRQAILQALAEQGRVVRLPLNRIGTISKIRKTSARLAQQHERAPSLEELANELEIDVEKVREAMQHAGRHLSMDAPFTEDNDNSLLDVLSIDEGIAPDDSLLDESVKIDIERALSLLHPREAEITRLYFGIGHERPLTLEEVGQRFGLTRERVRQIKEKALRKLRQKHSRTELKSHVG